MMILCCIGLCLVVFWWRVWFCTCLCVIDGWCGVRLYLRYFEFWWSKRLKTCLRVLWICVIWKMSCLWWFVVFRLGWVMGVWLCWLSGRFVLSLFKQLFVWKWSLLKLIIFVIQVMSCYLVCFEGWMMWMIWSGFGFGWVLLKVFLIWFGIMIWIKLMRCLLLIWMCCKLGLVW